MRTLAAAWNAFWFTPAAPWPLGLCRAGFFASFYLLFLARTDLRWYALFPSGFYQPRSFFAWLSLPTPSWEVMGWLVTAFEISVILAALGLLTRLATFTAFVLGLYVLGLQFNYGYLHWAHAIVPIVMGILALSPCGDALSLDALVRRAATGKAADTGGQYRWPIQLVRLVFVTVFLAAGLAKLRQAGLGVGPVRHAAELFSGEPVRVPLGRGNGLGPSTGGLAGRAPRFVPGARRYRAGGGTQRPGGAVLAPRAAMAGSAAVPVPGRQRAAAVPGFLLCLPGALWVLDTVGLEGECQLRALAKINCSFHLGNSV